MLETIGAHYSELAAGAAILFMLVLGTVSVRDAILRRRA